ncbi:elongin C [Tritrichomonas musculus]|uniref:Elongin-C n=1 Tax=Tritrichomonas musculus TaxID=1915356 RepID=A0ABR2L7M3_9EUKA
MISKTAIDILKEVEENTSSSSTDDADQYLKEEEEFNEPCPTIDLVTLISGDGRRFIIQRQVACLSPLLNSAFKPKAKFIESLSLEYHLPNVRGVVLEKIVDYLHYSFLYKNDISNAPKFDVSDDILLETLVASDYLMI